MSISAFILKLAENCQVFLCNVVKYLHNDPKWAEINSTHTAPVQAVYVEEQLVVVYVS